MLKESVSNNSTLWNGIERLESTLVIVLVIDDCSLVGNNLRTAAEHPRHLTQILSIDPANDTVDTDLTPLLAFLQQNAASQSVVLHPQFREDSTLHGRL